MPSIPLTFSCDETSHRGHRYAAVGGIACRPEGLHTINHEIITLKEAAGYQSEIKWEKSSNRYFSLYSNLVSYFFSLIEGNQIHFHVLICDFNLYDHNRLNDGVRERSVSKSYYQLFLHRLCRLYGDKCALTLRTDSGDCTKELPSFLGALNYESRQKFRCEPVSNIIPVRDSRHVPILGLNDLIIGAVASHRNGRHLIKDASGHKIALSNAVLSGFGLPHYEANTPWDKRRWTVWNWQPQPEERPALDARSGRP